MSGFNEVDNLASMNAWATSIKEQVEAAGQILRNPTLCKCEKDFQEILRKIATDFIREPATKRLIYDIATILADSNLKLVDYEQFHRQWDYIEQEMNIQIVDIFVHQMGLKLALLAFTAGPKPPKPIYNIREFSEAIDSAIVDREAFNADLGNDTEGT